MLEINRGAAAPIEVDVDVDLTDRIVWLSFGHVGYCALRVTDPQLQVVKTEEGSRLSATLTPEQTEKLHGYSVLMQVKEGSGNGEDDVVSEPIEVRLRGIVDEERIRA